MTGYGKAICEFEGQKYTIEIKSLNSKQLDLNTRIPYYFKEKELEIRNEILRHLQRGKIDLNIEAESFDEVKGGVVNKKILAHYIQQLKELSGELNFSVSEHIIASVLRMPDVLKKEKEELKPEIWDTVNDGILSAIYALDGFRKQEGKMIMTEITQRVQLISDMLESVKPYELERIESIRQRIQKNISEFIESEKIDNNRLEQELIFYIERIDFTEEKVRLANHCKYFNETLNDDSEQVGKKLGFIVQEMGREINTLGSKAYHSQIQIIVVNMKDELEKIKEQLMNIL